MKWIWNNVGSDRLPPFHHKPIDIEYTVFQILKTKTKQTVLL